MRECPGRRLPTKFRPTRISRWLRIVAVQWIFPVVVACLLLAGTPSFGNAQDLPIVAVSQIVEHPALDATRKGLRDGLQALGYIDGETMDFKYQTAQGNPAIAAQIARQFVGESPDVLVGIATPTAQALAAVTKTIPIVYTAVTDPVAAKLIASLERSENNVTGLSDNSPIDQHLELVREILPNATRLGVVYNPGEANAVALVEQLRTLSPVYGFTLIEGGATRTSEVQGAAQVVASNVDVIYAPTDNTIASAISSLTSVALEASVPVIAGETSYTDSGALAALGFDYYDIGRQTASYVDRILKGESPTDIPSRVATGSNLVLNNLVAAKLSIEFSDQLRDRATRIVR